MDQDYDRNAKNVVIREGGPSTHHVCEARGIIRWGGKEYVLKELLEVKDGDGCIEGCQSGDCQCNRQVSRCCP